MPSGAEMVVDGVVIGPATGGDVSAPISYGVGGPASAFAIRLPTLCGAHDFPVTANDYGVVMLNAPAVPMARVYIDNRGGTAGTLALGPVVVPVAADSSNDVRVAMPTCDTAPRVTINGADVGPLPAVHSVHDPTYVVAMRGPACYRFETVQYGMHDAPPPAAVVYGGRVISVDPIDYFLQRAPHSMQVIATRGERRQAEQTSIVPSPCRSAVAPVSPTSALSAGDVVQIASHDTWYPGHVLAVDGALVRVHYDNFTDASDESVSRDRLLGPYRAP